MRSGDNGVKLKRKRFNRRQRAQFFHDHGGICHICGQKIGVAERWDVDHVIALGAGGADELHNMAPAHVSCHREKTRGDTTAAAKVARVGEKHIGAHKPRMKINPTAARQSDLTRGQKYSREAIERRKAARQD